MAKQAVQQTSKKQTLREKAEKQKKAAVKAVLQNPFKTTWPSIPSQKQKELLEHLERLLQPLHDAKLQNVKKKKNADKESKEEDPVAAKIRSEFVLGVNSVTRMLEKDKLLLVLVCKSANPPVIVKHLAELSSVRCCPAMLINGLDNLLCSKLKIHSAVAIGFKKIKNGDSYFQEFISSVDIPEINFPYLSNHVAKFVIDTKGQKTPERDGCEKTITENRPRNRGRRKSLTQNQTPGTISARAAISKICSQKKKEGPEINPFKLNEDFIPLGTLSDDEVIPKTFNLRLTNSKSKDSIWEEIFAMRIVDSLNAKGVSIKRDDIDSAELSSLKSSLYGEQKTGPSKSVWRDKKRKGSNQDLHRKRLKIEGERPEYRVSEIKRIKGNVDKKEMKKKMKKKKKRSIEQIGEISTNLEEKKTTKSHLNKKTKSKLNKLKKALKKLSKFKV